MEILAKYISASTQIHTGKCWLIGLSSEGGKLVKAYNVEVSTAAAAANQVGYIHSSSSTDIYVLPGKGVKCSNGLYVTVDSADCLVYYSLG